jgi:hypothetical protein
VSTHLIIRSISSGTDREDWINEKISFWTWISDNCIAMVGDKYMYHFDIVDYDEPD